MPIAPETHYTQSFSSTVALLLQQRESKFEAAVTTGNYVGKQASVVDQVGSVDMQPVTSRFANKVRTDVNIDRRWVIPSDFDLTEYVDTFDQLRSFTDPRGARVQGMIASAKRNIDDKIIAAFTAAAMTGETGTTPTGIATGNTVGVNTGGSASGLNVAKLKKAFEILLAAEVDTDYDPIYCAITAKQNTDLLNEIQVISADFKQEQKPQVVNGKLSTFLGINFIHSQRLAAGTDDQSGTSRSLPMWAKSGMHLGTWANKAPSIRQAKEMKGEPWEAYLYQTIGATRIEENKVVRIWAREA